MDGHHPQDGLLSSPMPPFAHRLQHGALLLDGGFGSAIQDMDLDVDRDYLGQENCTEVLVRSRPELVQSIHASFLESGADAVETNTFGANRLVLAEFGLEGDTRKLNQEAAEIARAACVAAGGPPSFGQTSRVRGRAGRVSIVLRSTHDDHRAAGLDTSLPLHNRGNLPLQAPRRADGHRALKLGRASRCAHRTCHLLVRPGWPTHGAH